VDHKFDQVFQQNSHLEQRVTKIESKLQKVITKPLNKFSYSIKNEIKGRRKSQLRGQDQRKEATLIIGSNATLIRKMRFS
jgi:hypothetical protein